VVSNEKDALAISTSSIFAEASAVDIVVSVLK